MFNRFSQKEELIALHRRLYLLEEGRGQLKNSERLELYQLIQKKCSELCVREREYLDRLISERDIEASRKIIKAAQKRGINIITWYDDRYPNLPIEDKPPIFFLRGSVPDQIQYPYIAIVGSRKATKYGYDMTDYIVKKLAPYKVTIVSGLAYGIDAAAHRAAIKYKLPTLAILGSGIDNCYPVSHRELAVEICKDGGILSEFPWGTPPLKFNFPMRNRVISGLSKGVVVVEAEIRSGSLITARWAADQGREVFAVPGNVGRSLSSGPNFLIKSGAHLINDGEEIAQALGLEQPVTVSKTKKNPGQDASKDDIKQYILDFLANGGNDLENLRLKTGLPPERLLPLITKVEIERIKEG